MDEEQKKRLKIVFWMVIATIVFVLFMFGKAWLDDYQSKGFSFRLSDDKEYYIVVGYGGDGTEDAVIPKKYKRKPVTHIEKVNYGQEGKLGKLIIPNTITHIANKSYGFGQFTTIEYEGTVAEWCSIDFAFEYDNYTDSYFTMEGVENFYCAGEEIIDLVIPEGVTRINDGAFRGLYFNSIQIADSVEYVGSFAFFNYGDGSDTQEIYIGKNVSTLGENFACPTKKYSIDSENSYFTVSEGVLYANNWTELVAYPCAKENKTFKINSSVQKIRAYAFNGAKNLQLVTYTGSWRCERYSGTVTISDDPYEMLKLLLDCWEFNRV